MSTYTQFISYMSRCKERGMKPRSYDEFVDALRLIKKGLCASCRKSCKKPTPTYQCLNYKK